MLSTPEEKKVPENEKENNLPKEVTSQSTNIKNEDTKENNAQPIIQKENEKKDELNENDSENLNKINIIDNTNTNTINIIDDNKKDLLLKKLVNAIKFFLFKKKVRKLIKLQKENFCILSYIKEDGMTLEARINEDEQKKYNVVYEPILDQNIAYIPRSDYKKKNLLKFSFINSKNETVIEPKYNTEYEDGIFINVINLKKLKDAEEERMDDFQSFLELYYTSNEHNNNEDKIDGKNFNQSGQKQRSKKKHHTEVETSKVIKEKKNKSNSNLLSILKPRPAKRRPSERRISFGEIKFSY